MDELELLLKQQTETQKAAEEKRRADLRDQLMRQLELASNDPAVNLAPLAAIVPGNTPLVQAMQQSASQQLGEEGSREEDLARLQMQLIKNTGTGDLDPNQLLNLQMHKDRMAMQKKELAQKQLLAQKQATSGKQLSAKDILNINEGNAIPAMLSDIRGTLDVNKEIMGPVKGRIGQANPYDVRAQSVDAQMRAASQAFGRFMEGGVLRKEDEAKYRKMFPQLSDTPEVAQSKLAVVERQLTRKQKSDVDALKSSGYDVSSLGQIKEVTPLPQTVKGVAGPELIPSANAAAKAKDYNKATDAELDARMKELGIK